MGTAAVEGRHILFLGVLIAANWWHEPTRFSRFGRQLAKAITLIFPASRSAFAPIFYGDVDSVVGENLISVSSRTATALPSFLAGSNFHFATASPAAVSKSALERFRSLISRTPSSGVTIKDTTTFLCLSHLAGGVGNGVETGRGAWTSPPTHRTKESLKPKK